MKLSGITHHSKVMVLFGTKESNLDHVLLLKRFNNREITAFGEVYSILYNDLHYYAKKPYRETTVDWQDAVQDTFLSLWQTNDVVFESMTFLKGYLFVSIRNGFNRYTKKSIHIEKFKKYQLNDDKNFQVDIIESEIFGYFNHILDLLPEESAEILQLFFEGLSCDEIALKLGKTKQTIYNKKCIAIYQLKQKVPNDLFIIITHILLP